MARVSWDTAASLVLLYRAGLGVFRLGTWKMSCELNKAGVKSTLTSSWSRPEQREESRYCTPPVTCRGRMTIHPTSLFPTWSLAVFSLSVTIPGSLCSPMAWRLERRGGREDRLEER